MSWYLNVLQKYFVFSGRARRQEYWMFVLCNAVIGMMMGLVCGVLGKLLNMPHLAGVINAIYSLAILIPGIAVGVRRLHDTDHSGWFMLLIIVNIIFLARAGTPGANRYGSNPKEVPEINSPS